MRRPTTVTVAFIIWLLVVLVNIIGGIINLVANGSAAAAARLSGGALVGGAVFAFVVAIIELIIVFKMRDGRNWARIVLTILAVLQVITGIGVGAASGGSAFGWIGVVAVIVATICMFVGGANGYFRKR